jgi:hypothetical protein
MRTTALVLLFALTPRLAWADPPAPAASGSVAPVVPLPPGEDNIVVLKKGDPAPFTGQLFDQPTALRWGNYLLQYKFRLQADVELQRKLGGLDLQLAEKKLVLEKELYTKVTTDLQAKLDAANKRLAVGPAWYETPTFGFAAGIVTSLVVVGVTAAFVHATR